MVGGKLATRVSAALAIVGAGDDPKVAFPRAGDVVRSGFAPLSSKLSRRSRTITEESKRKTLSDVSTLRSPP